MAQPQYGHKQRKSQKDLLPWVILAGFLVWGFLIFSWTTGRIGAFLGYDAGLGKPLQIGNFVFYSPAAFWKWPSSIWDDNDVSRLANQGLAAFGGPMAIFALAAAAFRKPKAVKDLHGTACWAERKDIEEMGYLEGKGVYVGGWWDERKKMQMHLRHNGPAGVVSTATANMSLYRDPIVARNTACCDFRISDLMNHETPLNLYLVVSSADIDRTRPLFRIFISQLSRRLMEKMEFSSGGTKATYKHRLFLMLDEFTSLGKLAIIERAIAYMAGYGMKAYFIVQDTKQLNACYGQDNALMANCHVRIAYAPNIVETAEVLSKMTGTTTVVQYKETMNKGKGGGGSISATEVSRPLLTPDECMRLPGIKKLKGGIESGDMLIFTAGNYAIYGRQILHFLDPVFLKRACLPAPVVSDSLYFEREQRAVISTLEERPEESAAEAYKRYLYDLPEELEEVA